MSKDPVLLWFFLIACVVILVAYLTRKKKQKPPPIPPGIAPNDLVLLHQFTYPNELYLAKARLKSEGIACVVRDEMTVQVHNFMSNAIGGIRLEVRKEDVELAYMILVDGGFIVPNVNR